MMDYPTLNYRKYSLCEHISTFIILFATSSLTYTITNDINNIIIKTSGASAGKISCTDYLYTQYEIGHASNEYENHIFNSCQSHRFKYERLYSYILSNNINTSCLCQYNALDWVTNNIIGIGLSPLIYLWNALNGEINVSKEYYSQASDIYICIIKYNHNSQYIAIGTSDNIITLYVSIIFKPLSCGSADSMFIYLYEFNKNGIVYSIGTHYSTWTFEGSCYAINQKGDYGESVLENLELFYSHFRILQTDFNSNGHYYLACLYSYILSNKPLRTLYGDSSISADSNIRNHDFRQKNHLILIFNGHEQEVRGLKCNDNINAKYLAYDSNDNKCYICDFRNLLATGDVSGDKKICNNSTPSSFVINFKFRTISNQIIAN